MVSAGFLAVVLLSFWFIAIGLVYIARPQIMFKVYNFPTGAGGDHLTEAGERAYKRQGIGIILLGLFLIFASIFIYSTYS
jgi:hypothetical protein